MLLSLTVRVYVQFQKINQFLKNILNTELQMHFWDWDFYNEFLRSLREISIKKLDSSHYGLKKIFIRLSLWVAFFSHFDFSRKAKKFKPFFMKNEKKFYLQMLLKISTFWLVKSLKTKFFSQSDFVSWKSPKHSQIAKLSIFKHKIVEISTKLQVF